MQHTVGVTLEAQTLVPAPIAPPYVSTNGRGCFERWDLKSTVSLCSCFDIPLFAHGAARFRLQQDRQTRPFVKLSLSQACLTSSFICLCRQYTRHQQNFSHESNPSKTEGTQNGRSFAHCTVELGFWLSATFGASGSCTSCPLHSCNCRASRLQPSFLPSLHTFS